MPDPLLVAFLGVAAVLTVTPGPDMAFVTQAVLRHGRRAGLWASVGICAGLSVHATASAIGVSVLLARSAEAFTLLKLAGGLFLLYLGASSLLAARRRGAPPEAQAPGPAPHPRRVLVQGFLSNVLNPKVAVFYLAFLPQFIGPGDPALQRSVLLAGLHIAMGLVWLPLYASAVHRAGALLRTSHAKARLEQLTGALLMALGARLLLERGPARA